MAFPDVNELINSIKDDIGDPLADKAPEQSESTAPEPVTAPEPAPASEESVEAKAPEAPKTAEEIADLAALIGEKKFKFQGQEYTLKELERAAMRQADYTKKTQEIAKQKKEYESSQKMLDYYKNVDADMAAVKANPALLAQFKSIYPKEFHNRVADIEASAPWTEERVAQIIESRMQERLSPLEQSISKRESDALVAQFENWDQELGSKYQYADQELAYAMIEKAKLAGTPLNKETWENAYKATHEKIKGLADKVASERVSTKTKLNVAGKDTKSGGGVPAKAPEKVNLKNAMDHVWASMNSSGD